MAEWDEVQAFQAQGHQIDILDLSQYHVVFGPNMHLMMGEMRPYFTAAIKATQQRLNREKKAAKGAKRAS